MTPAPPGLGEADGCTMTAALLDRDMGRDIFGGGRGIVTRGSAEARKAIGQLLLGRRAERAVFTF